MRLLLFIPLLFCLIQCNGQQNDYKTGIDLCMNEMESSGKGMMPPPICMKGHTLPSFELETIEGEIISNETIKGKPTVLNFWFIGCPPCEAEIPGFQKLVEEYEKQGVIFIAVGRNDKKYLDDFFAENPWNFKHVNDPESQILLNTFNMFWGYPTTFVVDKNGVIQEAFSGGPSDASAPEVIVQKLTPVLDYLLK